jgi:universal stress protein A
MRWSRTRRLEPTAAKSDIIRDHTYIRGHSGLASTLHRAAGVRAEGTRLNRPTRADLGDDAMPTKNILVALDFSDPSRRALTLAAELSQKLHATLHVLHVHPDVYDGRGEPALGIPWPTPGQEERYMRFLDTELSRILLEVLGSGAEQVQHHIVRGDPTNRIIAVADEVKADLLCVGSTGRGGVARVMLGSTSQSVLRRAKVPVLTVH